MAIFVNADTKVIVQGLTGGQGKYHGLRNQAYGTQVVGCVTPGKGGTDVEGIPVFNSVAEAVAGVERGHIDRRQRSGRPSIGNVGGTLSWSGLPLKLITFMTPADCPRKSAMSLSHSQSLVSPSKVDGTSVAGTNGRLVVLPPGLEKLAKAT